MPSPPDMYSVKRHLMVIIPEGMETDMRKIHEVTAESSSVNQIMQAALACERSHKARHYYKKACEELKRAKRQQSRSCSKERKKQYSKGHNQRESSRSPSPRRLQIIDRRRYSVKPHSVPKNNRPDYPRRANGPPRPNPQQQRRDFNRKFQPFCRKPWDNSGNGQKGNNERLFQMIDKNGKPSTQLFRIAEVSASEDEHCDSDQEIWDRYDSEHEQDSQPDEHSHSDSGSESESNGSNLNGSQYFSDAADEAYIEHVNFMQDESSICPKHLNAIHEPPDSDHGYDSVPEPCEVSEPELDDEDGFYRTCSEQNSTPESSTSMLRDYL
ncbi:hypothetical protein L218DRAFT_1007169 [Marasmius fiardii PR-910]|nr:hypothetical protein L218DRAFT_1007169 [Marasmius fiardii PR-910]